MAKTRFYVAVDGRDGNPGTARAPFATIRRAREAVRALRKESGPGEGVEVFLRAGTHRLESTFRLGEEDSGAPGAPVTWRGHPGEEAILSAGVELDPAAFAPVEDEETLRRIPPAARGRVFRFDLRSAGYRDTGTVEEGTFGSLRDFCPARPELYFNRAPMTLARWPNSGFSLFGRVSVPGSREPARDGEFEVFTGPGQLERWRLEDDIRLAGYFAHGWDFQVARAAAADPARSLVKAGPPIYEYKEGCRYYAFNLLAELDAPGEYYIDRKSGQLYFYPPAPLAGARIQLSRETRAPRPGEEAAGPGQAEAMIFLDGAGHIAVRDLVLEAGRGHGIVIEGGEGNLVGGCTLRNIGCVAVKISGGRNHAVRGCDIHGTGAGGIIIDGGDRRTLAPSGHAAVNNHIRDYSRRLEAYAGAIRLSGVGSRAAHNLIHDAAHTAVFFSGNDHLIEYNEIYNVCLETSDAGAVYAGRNWTMRGNRVRFNFIHHLVDSWGGEAVKGVYLDDLFSSAEVFGNVFFRTARAILFGGGRDNSFENNLLLECLTSAIFVDERGIGWYRGNIAGHNMPGLREVPYRGEPWRSRYPELAGILEDDPELPKGNRVRNNVIGGRAANIIGETVARHGSVENNILFADPGEIGAADYRRMDFALRPDSPVFRKLPGFKPIPFGRIGLRRDEFRPEIPPRAVIERPADNLLLEPGKSSEITLERVPGIPGGRLAAELPPGWRLDRVPEPPFEAPLTVRVTPPPGLDHTHVGTRVRFNIFDRREALVYQFTGLAEFPDPRFRFSLALPKQNWLFRTDPDEAGEAAGWFAPGLDEKEWLLFEIERFWGFFGFQDYHGVAWYRRTLTLPRKPSGAKKAELAFGAVDKQARAWVNGHFAGEHDLGDSGWNKPFALDVTDLLRWGGENLVAVRVRSMSNNGGIWKPVRLRIPRE